MYFKEVRGFEYQKINSNDNYIGRDYSYKWIFKI